MKITVGSRWRHTDGSIDQVTKVSGDRVTHTEVAGPCGDPPRPYLADADTTEAIFRAVHEACPIETPTPATPQHPADLKPRGVKAPMYLIPWEAVPEALRHPALRGADLSPSAILLRLASGITSLEDVARVFEYGAKKYARDNWKMFTWDDSARDEYYGAIGRHLLAKHGGQDLDPESGLPHEAHAACGCLIMLWHERELERQTKARADV